MDEIFLGGKDDELRYFAKKGEKPPEYDEVEEKRDPLQDVHIIDLETLEPLTPEEERILSRTRCLHDPSTVYMQRNVSFYDRFYNDEEVKNNEILKAMHSTRKMYRKYQDYKQALWIWDAYMDWILEEKFHGNIDLYREVIHGSRKQHLYWVPPKPIFINPDNLSISELEEELFSTSKCWTEPTKEDLEDVDRFLSKTCIVDPEAVTGHVTVPLTDTQAYLTIKEVMSDYREFLSQAEEAKRRRMRNVNQEVRSIIQSWYREDVAALKTDDKEDRIFYYSPEKIQERFYERLNHYDKDPELDRIMFDADYEEDVEVDTSTTVHDPVTLKAMSRGEYLKRLVIRRLGKTGWNELELMNMLQVGSRQEKSKLERTAKRAEAKKYKVTEETMRLREMAARNSENFHREYNQTLNIVDELDQLLSGRDY